MNFWCGKALKDRRDEFFLVSKVRHGNWSMEKKRLTSPRKHRKQLSAKGQLKRCQTGTTSIYIIASLRLSCGKSKESAGALGELVKEG